MEANVTRLEKAGLVKDVGQIRKQAHEGVARHPEREQAKQKRKARVRKDLEDGGRQDGQGSAAVTDEDEGLENHGSSAAGNDGRTEAKAKGCRLDILA